MLRSDIESIVFELGEEFAYAEKAHFGHLVRCGQKIPQKLKIYAENMAANAFFATLLVTDEFSPVIGEELEDKNGVVWLIDAVSPVYEKGEVQGYFLVLRSCQGIGRA